MRFICKVKFSKIQILLLFYECDCLIDFLLGGHPQRAFVTISTYDCQGTNANRIPLCSHHFLNNQSFMGDDILLEFRHPPKFYGPEEDYPFSSKPQTTFVDVRN